MSSKLDGLYISSSINESSVCIFNEIIFITSEKYSDFFGNEWDPSSVDGSQMKIMTHTRTHTIKYVLGIGKLLDCNISLFVSLH